MKSIQRKTKSINSDSVRITKEQLMMEFATSTSKRSTCSRLKVGAVIADRYLHSIKAYGYNGNWAGGPNRCDSDIPGQCGCIHSEINALIKPGRTTGEVMFLTDSPCKNCAKVIINSGITKVYYKNEYRLKDGINLLKKAKIKVEKI